MSTAPRPDAYRYSLFGLQIESELPLPELFEGDPHRPADVIIECARVPGGSETGYGLHSVDGGTLLVIEDGARYLVCDGKRIVVDAPEGASERNVRLFLLGSAFGLLIHQRKLLPLHANAVAIDGKVVAFMGHSGVGKSTLAAWFSDAGYQLIADDVTVVGFEGDRPIVRPGLPRLRLWREVIEATGRNPAEFDLAFEGNPTYDKRDVLLPRGRVASEAQKLGAIVELSRSGSAFETLRGAAAAEAVVSNTYRGGFLREIDAIRDHWSISTRLVQSVPVYRACVAFDLGKLDASYEPLLDSVRAALAEPANRD